MRRLPIIMVSAVAVLSFGIFVGWVGADSFAYSFSSKGSIKAGQVVALSKADKNTVELAPAKDLSRIYGVAVNPTDAPIAIQNPGQNVVVATSGKYKVLTSTENGPIAAGDYLSLSSHDGIAAKVRSGQAYIIGRATESFNPSGKGTTGMVSTSIMPGKSPSSLQIVWVPTLLRRLGETIAGKPLSASRIYSALAIFMVAALIALTLLWAGVKNGLIAIGRNPLSQHSILRSLVQIIIASCIVFAGGLFGVYLFLRV